MSAVASRPQHLPGTRQSSINNAAHPLVAGVLAVLCSFAALDILALRTRFFTSSSPGFSLPEDHHKYIYMAQHNPLDFHIAPFCYRIVTPLLAKLLPFSLETNFFLIAFVSTWLSALLVFAICRHYKLSYSYAFIGMLLFLSATLSSKIMISDFWLSDPLALLLITLAFYLAILRKPLAFALVLAIGVATRETVLLVAVLYYTLQATQIIDRRALARFFLVTVPALLTIFALHIAIPARNSDPSYRRTLPRQDWVVHYGSYQPDTISSAAHQFIHNFFSISYEIHILGRGLNAIGLSLVLLAIIGGYKQPTLFVRYVPFLLLSYCQFYVWDTTRYIASMMPALVVLAVFGLAFLVSHIRRVHPLFFVAIPVVILLSNMISTSSDPPGDAIQCALLVLFALAVALLTVAGQPRSGAGRRRTAARASRQG